MGHTSTTQFEKPPTHTLFFDACDAKAGNVANLPSCLDHGKDIISTEDCKTSHWCDPINTGVFIMQARKWTQRFWQRVWELKDEFHERYNDQSSVIRYRTLYPDDFEKHAAIVPQQTMNQIDKPNAASITKSFIRHAAGGHKNYTELKGQVSDATRAMSQLSRLRLPHLDVLDAFGFTVSFDDASRNLGSEPLETSHGTMRSDEDVVA